MATFYQPPLPDRFQLTGVIVERRQLVKLGDGGAEGGEADGVDGLVDHFTHDAQGFLHGHGLAIRPVSRQGVEDVRDGDDARVHIDLVARQAIGIAFAVQAFMVTACNGGNVAKSLDVRQNFLGKHRVFFDFFEFGFVQSSGLIEHRVGHAQLADIVQQGRAAKPAAFFG